MEDHDPIPTSSRQSEEQQVPTIGSHAELNEASKLTDIKDSSVHEAVVPSETTEADKCDHNVVLDSDRKEERIVRVVKCQINVRLNGALEVVVSGDETMSRKLEDLLQVQSPKSLIEGKLLDFIKFSHLTTFSELQILENFLKDPLILRTMLEKLKSTGGKSPEDFLRNILSHLMRNELVMSLTWKRFKDFKKLMTLITDLTMEMFPEHTTVFQLQNIIKNWLKKDKETTTL